MRFMKTGTFPTRFLGPSRAFMIPHIRKRNVEPPEICPKTDEMSRVCQNAVLWVASHKGRSNFCTHCERHMLSLVRPSYSSLFSGANGRTSWRKEYGRLVAFIQGSQQRLGWETALLAWLCGVSEQKDPSFAIDVQNVV